MLLNSSHFFGAGAFTKSTTNLFLPVFGHQPSLSVVPILIFFFCLGLTIQVNLEAKPPFPNFEGKKLWNGLTYPLGKIELKPSIKQECKLLNLPVDVVNLIMR